MTLAQDKARYFWLAANDPVTTTQPEPPSFDNSTITPLVDMEEYVQEFSIALAEVGKSATPADNAGDFIYLANWWLGLNGGKVTIPTTASALGNGPLVTNPKPFAIDPTDITTKHLRDILKEKQKRGVEVRVLGWASFAVLSLNPLAFLPASANQAVALSIMANAASIVNVNAETIDAVFSLRAAPNAVPQSMLNVMGHSAGAAHIKCALVGKKNGANAKAVGFSGGLDWQMSRWAMMDHIPDPTWKINKDQPFWHDVQAKIEGDATQALYDLFRALWADNLAAPVRNFNVNGKTVPHRTAAMTPIPARTIDAPLLPGATLTQSVQSLRTIPAANYASLNQFPQGRPSTIAPNGLFEVRAGWHKAITGAQNYIYIEDQAFWSMEIMEWIRERVRAIPALKVIMVMPGAGDPNDGDASMGDLLFETFNEGLLGIGTLNPLPASAQNRIRVFQLWGDMIPDASFTVDSVDTSDPAFNRITTTFVLTAAIRKNVIQGFRQFVSQGANNWKVLGNPALASGAKLQIDIAKAPAPPAAASAFKARGAFGLTVHSKVTLIDDKWAIVGSANHARRSLYTDWEHSVAFIDTGNAVKEFRKKLWNEHFNSPGVADFEFADAAIAAWDQTDPTWNTLAAPVIIPAFPTRPAGNLSPNFIERITLPLAAPNPPLVVPIPAARRTRLDKFIDPDSRQAWGGITSP